MSNPWNALDYKTPLKLFSADWGGNAFPTSSLFNLISYFFVIFLAIQSSFALNPFQSGSFDKLQNGGGKSSFCSSAPCRCASSIYWYNNKFLNKFHSRFITAKGFDDMYEWCTLTCLCNLQLIWGWKCVQEKFREKLIKSFAIFCLNSPNPSNDIIHRRLRHFYLPNLTLTSNFKQVKHKRTIFGQVKIFLFSL